MFTDGIIADVVVDPLKRWTDDRGWLIELFRVDDLKEGFAPAMGYVSETQPGVGRGPHEHVDQADVFVFIGPGDFRMQMWDNRPQSPTYRVRQVFTAGASAPTRVIVPVGVVHGYRNISTYPALVLNFPNRLYKGVGRKEPVDEIRHEADPNSPFHLE